MINCAHPTHFEGALLEGEPWTACIRGAANASRRSHAELNESPKLDAADPDEFGEEHARPKRRFEHINVTGGCCRTDRRHVERIAPVCSKLPSRHRRRLRDETR